jgi:hypothetical protein
MRLVRTYSPDPQAQVQALRLLLSDPSGGWKQPRAAEAGSDASKPGMPSEVGPTLRTVSQQARPSLSSVGVESNQCLEV